MSLLVLTIKEHWIEWRFFLLWRVSALLLRTNFILKLLQFLHTRLVLSLKGEVGRSESNNVQPNWPAIRFFIPSSFLPFLSFSVSFSYECCFILCLSFSQRLLLAWLAQIWRQILGGLSSGSSLLILTNIHNTYKPGVESITSHQIKQVRLATWSPTQSLCSSSGTSQGIWSNSISPPVEIRGEMNSTINEYGPNDARHTRQLEHAHHSVVQLHPTVDRLTWLTWLTSLLFSSLLSTSPQSTRSTRQQRIASLTFCCCFQRWAFDMFEVENGGLA